MSPLRQWCWMEFHPASIMSENGKWRVMACQWQQINFSGLQSAITASIAALLQCVRYEIVVCSGKWDIRAVCFVGMLGSRHDILGVIISIQHQAVILRFENSLFHPLQLLWFHYTLIRLFSSIPSCTETSQSHSPFIKNMVKFIA